MPTLSTASGVYERVKTLIGKLSRRLEEELIFPSERDEDALQIYLEDALTEVATITERVNTSVQLTTTPDQAYVSRPPYLHMIRKAAVYTDSTAYELEVKDGPDVARWGRAPDAKTGRPDYIGAHDGDLYLWPVPAKEYTLDLQITHNGAVADNGTAPSGPEDPPELDTIVAAVPAELDRALAAYVTAEWLKDTGSPEAGAQALQRFNTDVRRHRDEPVHQSSSTRPYRPLGF